MFDYFYPPPKTRAMTSRRDQLDEAQAIFDEAVAIFEAAKEQFGTLTAEIRKTLDESREARAGLREREEAAGMLFIRFEQLTAKWQRMGTRPPEDLLRHRDGGQNVSSAKEQEASGAGCTFVISKMLGFRCTLPAEHPGHHHCESAARK